MVQRKAVNYVTFKEQFGSQKNKKKTKKTPEINSMENRPFPEIRTIVNLQFYCNKQSK